MREFSMDHELIKAEVLERFLRYVRVGTTSDRKSDLTPSTAGQWELARMLEQELRALGLTDVELDDHCYLIARMPASSGMEKAPVIGFMAHVDTASDVSGHNVQPQVIEHYDGKPIAVGSYTLDPREFPQLTGYVGDTIVTTDGTTLLGGDDKAGIAEIMTAVRWLTDHPEVRHGEVEIIFTPDEETGRGMDRFPKAKLKSRACYTFDGGAEGRIEAECFNAWRCDIAFTGSVIHLGDARGKLVNAVSMAAAFMNMIPRTESPEATDGYYGYYCPLEIRGNLEHAELEVYLRDHDRSEIERRIEALSAFALAVEAAFPGGSVEVSQHKQYLNMYEVIQRDPLVMEKLRDAMTAAGYTPQMHAIRGGTDGSRLTEMGIPTPNLSAGEFNMHSRLEWVPVGALARITEVAVKLILAWAA
ncbi:MAG: peptidase T [Spirochaetaceae bacterium]|nr:MAG: peptidase T [Spirochaetaceae bacterium]